MADILTSINTRKTPQGSKAQPDQVKNNAGGYVFQIGDEARLHRFLTLGTDVSSYYQKAIELTRENADVVFRMAANKPDEAIKAILDVSEAGRAPKNKQAIFALAIVASAADPTTRSKAMAIMHRVCRTGTHVFEFNKYVEQFRGRGPSLNRNIGNWYKLKPVDKLAYQVTKYRARQDWTHRDLLRLVKGHAGKTGEISAERDALLGWVARGVTPEGGFGAGELAIVQDYLDAKAATHPTDWVNIIHRGNGLSWEMLPDAAMKSPAVWEAMIEQGIPQTALIRNLPRLTNVFGGSGNWVSTVAAQLVDQERLTKARVHPVNVLVAQRTYQSGQSVRGTNTWHPVTALVDALDEAFYKAFGGVEPTGKRTLLALDVSGSMTSSALLDYDQKGRVFRMPISAREVGAALSLVTMATEAPGSTEVVVFTADAGAGARSRRFAGYAQRGRLAVPTYTYTYGGGGGYGRENDCVRPFDISPRRRLDDVLRATQGLPLGATDCALPFTWAQANDKDFDGIVILTDNETWAGPIHVHQALDQYRNGVGHDVKLVAVGLTATNYSVADPKDTSSLDVSGFDSAVPSLISDFIAERL